MEQGADRVMNLSYLDEVVNEYKTLFKDKVEETNKKTILFLPTNGTGLGHMTRLLAIAKWVSKLNPEIQIVFFTTSYGYKEIKEEGFTVYYFPSRDLCTGEVISSVWNKALEKALRELATYYNPSCLVFDGTFPYLGIMMGISECDNIKKIWVKRGNNKIEDSEKVRKKEAYFDLIIEPGEVGIVAPDKEDYYYCNPIIYLSRQEILERKEARRLLEIPEGATAIYIQLGAGKINEIEDDINAIIQVVEQKGDVYIVVGESIIGKQLHLEGKHVKVIREYPNARYFNAFDVAFSAAGYNTFHELIYFSLPTIFIPNQATQKDSQVKRAEAAKNSGAAEVACNCEKQIIDTMFNQVLQNNQKMRKNANQLITNNGAEEVAQIILKTIGECYKRSDQNE